MVTSEPTLSKGGSDVMPPLALVGSGPSSRLHTTTWDPPGTPTKEQGDSLTTDETPWAPNFRHPSGETSTRTVTTTRVSMSRLMGLDGWNPLRRSRGRSAVFGCCAHTRDKSQHQSHDQDPDSLDTRITHVILESFCRVNSEHLP